MESAWGRRTTCSVDMYVDRKGDCVLLLLYIYICLNIICSVCGVQEFPVRDFLKDGENVLNVSFLSPVVYASERRKAHSAYRVPPECPPDVQKGECHINFIRKVGFSPHGYLYLWRTGSEFRDACWISTFWTAVCLNQWAHLRVNSDHMAECVKLFSVSDRRSRDPSAGTGGLRSPPWACGKESDWRPLTSCSSSRRPASLCTVRENG